jgi:hypothetical protein
MTIFQEAKKETAMTNNTETELDIRKDELETIVAPVGATSPGTILVGLVQ